MIIIVKMVYHLINYMNIYLPSGYLDIHKILSVGYPFTFIIGGRGTGKTYGVLEDTIEHDVYSLYMRRTQTQCDMMCDPRYNPFLDLNIDKGWNITVEKDVKNLGLYKEADSETELGLIGALSTFGNIRGFSGAKIKRYIYDEFIPEPHHKKIKNEAGAFYNSYETINRNRELKGQKPLQAVCLSNSEDIECDILGDMKLISHLEKMAKKKQEVKFLPERGILLIYILNSKISEAKKQTALYKATSGTNYSDMAIENKFAQLEKNNVRNVSLKEYNPFVIIGDICLYYHKSKNKYYCCFHKSGSPPQYDLDKQSLILFRQNYSFLITRYITRDISFVNYECEVAFKKCLDIF